LKINKKGKKGIQKLPLLAILPGEAQKKFLKNLIINYVVKFLFYFYISKKGKNAIKMRKIFVCNSQC